MLRCHELAHLAVSHSHSVLNSLRASAAPPTLPPPWLLVFSGAQGPAMWSLCLTLKHRSPPADPPDTVKARLQVQGSGGADVLYRGTADAFAKIAAREVGPAARRAAACPCVQPGYVPCLLPAKAGPGAPHERYALHARGRRVSLLPARSRAHTAVPMLAYLPPWPVVSTCGTSAACPRLTKHCTHPTGSATPRGAGGAWLLSRLWRHLADRYPGQHVVLQVGRLVCSSGGPTNCNSDGAILSYPRWAVVLDGLACRTSGGLTYCTSGGINMSFFWVE